MSEPAPRSETRYRARATTYSVALDDEVLIWDDAEIQLHRLNPSAARVWSELTQWRSCSEVTDALAGVLALETVPLRADVEACIADLARAGLLETR